MDKPMKKLLALTVMISVLAPLPAGSENKRTIMRGNYYSLEERYLAYENLSAGRKELVTMEQFGASVRGIPLVVLRISRNDGKERAEVLITGNIHATEFMGGRMAFEIAMRLAEGDGVDPWITSLLDRMDFYIAPLMNPDGYAAAYRHLSRGFTVRRDNANRVDLNRNFPYPRGVEVKDYRAGSNIKIHPNYRGPHPLSEPETLALTRLVKQRRFFVGISFHTTGGYLIYPHGFTAEPPPDKDIFVAMGKSLNDHQRKKPYKVHQGFEWYQTVGSLNDWLYRRFGILSVTVELARPDRRLINPLRAYNPFWWYNPVNVNEWLENDLDANLHAIETAFELSGGEPREPLPTDWVTTPSVSGH